LVRSPLNIFFIDQVMLAQLIST